MTTRRSRIRRVLPFLVLLLLATGLRLWMPGPVDVTTDEPAWLMRSHQFSTAIRNADPAKATAWGVIEGESTPTMPGVTTMWAGSAGRMATRVGSQIGINAPLPAASVDSAALLRWSRSIVALMVAAGVTLSAWAATRLVGRTAGLTFGVLCAIEPWFVGLSFVLHTDALVAVFGTLSLIAMAAAFQPVPDGRRGKGDRLHAHGIDPVMAGLSAVGGALALLTKMNAAALVFPGVAVIVAWNLFGRYRYAAGPERLLVIKRFGALTAVWIVIVCAVSFVLWPSLWVHPLSSVAHTVRAVTQPGGHGEQFFMGRKTANPGPAFYPVTFAFRLSPWLLVGVAGVVLTGVVALVARTTGRQRWIDRLPRQPWVVLAAATPYAVAITVFGKKYDRYALPLMPVLALFVASLIVHLARLVHARWFEQWSRLHVRIAATLCVLVLAGYVVSEAPYAISYINPMLGGQTTAQHVMMLGWGEGSSSLGEVIQEREAGNCDRIAVAGLGGPIQVPCGRRPGSEGLRTGDYFAVNIKNAQRHFTAENRAAFGRFTYRKIAETNIHGVPYVTLYQVTSVEKGH